MHSRHPSRAWNTMEELGAINELVWTRSDVQRKRSHAMNKPFPSILTTRMPGLTEARYGERWETQRKHSTLLIKLSKSIQVMPLHGLIAEWPGRVAAGSTSKRWSVLSRRSAWVTLTLRKRLQFAG